MKKTTRKFYAQRWTPYGWVTFSHNPLNTLAGAKFVARFDSNAKRKRVLEVSEKVHAI